MPEVRITEQSLALMSSVRLRDLVKALAVENGSLKAQINQLSVAVGVLVKEQPDMQYVFEPVTAALDLSGYDLRSEPMPNFLNPDAPPRRRLSLVPIERQEVTNGPANPGDADTVRRTSGGDGLAPSGDGNAPGDERPTLN